MIISLTGFMGCGKSSVGKELSKLLCCPFMDLDDVIEERSGRRIPEIFATEGEAEFRRMEKDALRDIVAQPATNVETEKVSAVLALGGGAVMTKECAELINEKTFCIYLRATVDTLVSHLTDETDSRPMLNIASPNVTSGVVLKNKMSGTVSKDEAAATVSKDEASLKLRIIKLMSERSSTYEATAHTIINTDGKSVEEISEEIASTLSVK